jgi:CBS domain-containing protein
MNAGDICSREVATAHPEETVAAAALRMRERSVGDLVVVDEEDEGRVPVGVITDRDVVVEVVALGLDPEKLLVRDLAGGRPVYLVAEDESLADAVHRMNLHGVRRIPVVDHQGTLVGILTLDDVVATLADQLGEMAGLIGKQRGGVAPWGGSATPPGA